MAWRCHRPPRQHWSTPGPRGSIASRSGPGQLVSFFRRRLFRSPRCEAESPSGFMAGICQINHTTDQRRTKRRPLGKSTPLPHPIRALGTRAKFRLAGQPPLLASSSSMSSAELPFSFLFLFESQGYQPLTICHGNWDAWSLITTSRFLFSPDTWHLLASRLPQRQS